MDFHELKTKTVAELREVAKGVEGFSGSSQMNKQQLLAALCEELGIAMHEHHEVVGIDKAEVKARIQELKKERAAALDAGDHAAYKRALDGIRRGKRALRRAAI